MPSSWPPGGSRRMAGQDKLAAPIGGRPLLAWTLERLAAAPEVDRIVVVTSAERLADVRRRGLAAGLGRRRDRRRRPPPGVRRGRASSGWPAKPGGADPDRVILVQDGARPLVIARARRRGRRGGPAEFGAAIPVLAMAETVKRIAGGRIVETLDRADLGTAQTPQGIRRGLLEQAYLAFPPDGEPTFTDEAGLLEACRIPVHVVPGDPDEPQGDRARGPRPGRCGSLGPGAVSTTGRVRVGFGSDGHPFGPGEPLALGGIRSTARRDSTATPTATSPSMRWPTRCSGPAAWATSAGSSRRDRQRPAGIASGRAAPGGPRAGAAPPATGRPRST